MSSVLPDHRPVELSLCWSRETLHSSLLDLKREYAEYNPLVFVAMVDSSASYEDAREIVKHALGDRPSTTLDWLFSLDDVLSLMEDDSMFAGFDAVWLVKPNHAFELPDVWLTYGWTGCSSPLALAQSMADLSTCIAEVTAWATRSGVVGGVLTGFGTLTLRIEA
jgi:hypothetical protein